MALTLSPGQLYVMMRFIEGSDLDELVAREGALDATRARGDRRPGRVRARRRARGLVHRDIKPANVLLARHEHGDHAYLTDLPLSGPPQSPSAQRISVPSRRETRRSRRADA